MTKKFQIDKVTNHFLEEKRKRMDQSADQLVQKMVTSGQHAQVSLKLKELIRNDSYSNDLFKDLPPTLSEEVTHYFDQSGKLPPWADEKLIHIGQDVFSRYVPLIMMILQYKSLPLCYSCKNGAKILHLTGRLTDRYGKSKVFGRLLETAQMVINTMSPGAFDRQGKGILVMQKVRIIHALVRYFVKSPSHNKYGWQAQELGEPINQEDLAGTLMSFGPTIINGLKQLNINLREEEILGYMHCWKVIGFLTGLDEDLLPDKFEDGWELAIRIIKHQAAPSEEGMELTRSCVDLHKKITGGLLFDDASNFMIQYFLKDACTDSGLDILEMIGANNDCADYRKIVHALSRLATIGVVNKAALKGYHKFHDLYQSVHLSFPHSLGRG